MNKTKIKLSFDIEEEYVKKLEEKARKLDRSKSWIIRNALKEYLDKN